jgi:peptidoglycan-associated lipoprotein
MTMTLTRWKISFVAITYALLLAACGGNVQDEGAGGAGTGVETGGVSGAQGLSGQELGADGYPLTTRIFFAFDSSRIDDNSRETLETNASYLSAHPDVKVKLEGHCDERGTREYNLALGERRAKAAADLMKVLGIDGSRISTVSYGEEKPLVDGHDEAAWAKNRRVEIVYPGR